MVADDPALGSERDKKARMELEDLVKTGLTQTQLQRCDELLRAVDSVVKRVQKPPTDVLEMVLREIVHYHRVNPSSGAEGFDYVHVFGELVGIRDNRHPSDPPPKGRGRNSPAEIRYLRAGRLIVQSSGEQGVTAVANVKQRHVAPAAAVALSTFKWFLSAPDRVDKFCEDHTSTNSSPGELMPEAGDQASASASQVIPIRRILGQLHRLLELTWRLPKAALVAAALAVGLVAGLVVNIRDGQAAYAFTVNLVMIGGDASHAGSDGTVQLGFDNFSDVDSQTLKVEFQPADSRSMLREMQGNLTISSDPQQPCYDATVTWVLMADGFRIDGGELSIRYQPSSPTIQRTPSHVDRFTLTATAHASGSCDLLQLSWRAPHILADAP